LFSPETITGSPRTESLFYVRIENPEIKIGYIPKIKVSPWNLFRGHHSRKYLWKNISKHYKYSG